MNAVLAITAVLIACAGVGCVSVDPADSMYRRQSARLMDSISSMVISEDERCMAVGRIDGSLQLWDLQTGKCKGMVQAHTGEVSAVLLTRFGYLTAGHTLPMPTNRHMLGTHAPRVDVALWQSDTLTPIRRFKLQEIQPPVGVALSGSNSLVVSSYSEIVVWDIRDGAKTQTLVRHSADRFGHLMPSRSVIRADDSVDSTNKHSLLYWRLQGDSPQLVGVQLESALEVVCISAGFLGAAGECWAPNAKYVALCGWISGSFVKVWDLDSRKLVLDIEGDQDDDMDFQRVAFSPDCRTLFATGDRYVFAWDVQSGESFGVLGGRSGGRHRDWAAELAVSPSGHLVASSAGSKVYVWRFDGRQASLLRVLDGHGTAEPRGRTLKDRTELR